jgi:hypothetical protein
MVPLKNENVTWVTLREILGFAHSPHLLSSSLLTLDQPILMSNTNEPVKASRTLAMDPLGKEQLSSLGFAVLH